MTKPTPAVFADTPEGLLREALARGPAFRVGCLLERGNAPQQAISPNEIVDAVAKFYRWSPKEIRSPNRTRTLVLARGVAAYLVKKLRPHVSYPELSRVLGGKDHTTMIHAVRKTHLLLASDDLFRREVELLEVALSSSALGPCGDCLVCRAQKLLEGVR